jgi:hypothetical protein
MEIIDLVADFTDGELAAEITRRNRTGLHLLDREQGWVQETYDALSGSFSYVPVDPQ